MAVTYQHLHPWRGTEYPIPPGISLTEQFGHPVFRVYRADTKGFLDYLMYLFPDHLTPPALHAAGFHNDDIAEINRMLFRQVKQRKGDSHQQHFQSCCPGLFNGLQKSRMVIREKTAGIIARELHKSVNHVYERRILPLKI